MTDELKNLYALARRAKDDGNDENAAKYYEMILLQNPDDWEANFYTTYYQARSCKIGEIRSAATKLANSERTVFTLIKNNADPVEYSRILDKVCAKLIEISGMLFVAYANHFNGIGDSIRNNYCNEYLAVADVTRSILYNAGDLIIEIFGDNLGAIAAECWESGVILHSQMQKNIRYWSGVASVILQNRSVMGTYNAKILKYKPSYNASSVYMGPTEEEMRSEERGAKIGKAIPIIFLVAIFVFIVIMVCLE